MYRYEMQWIRKLPLFALVVATGCSRVQTDQSACVCTLVEERIGEKVGWDHAEALEPLLDQELTSRAAIQIALLNNPTIHAAFEEIGIAQADLIEAKLLPNPLFAGMVRFPDKHAHLNTEFSLTQSLIDVLLIPLRTRIATCQLVQTELEVAATILQIVFEVEKTYYRLQAEQRKIELRKPLLETTEVIYSLAEAQNQQGNNDILDTQQRKLEWLEIKAEASKSQIELARLREEMNILLGAIGWTINATLPDLPKEEVSLNCMEEIVLTQRLDLQLARIKIDTLSRRYGTKQGWVYTNPTLGISTEKDPEGIRTTGPTFSLELPLFNHGQADRARICAQFRQSIKQYHAKENEALAALRSAFAKLSIHRELVLTYKDELLPLQEKFLDHSTQFYNAMALSVYRLLDAKKKQLILQIEYEMALCDYWISTVDLKQALGGTCYEK